jgi:hypothetical protein
MEGLISAIKQAINCENWFAALFISLTLPDICGAIENPKMENGKRYQSWFNKYFPQKNKNFFTAKDCWLLRNACLHAGSNKDARMAFEKVHFTVPGGPTVSNNVFNNVLQLQIDIFCNDLCDAVTNWLNDMKNNNEVMGRVSKLMKIHPISSLKPFINFA